MIREKMGPIQPCSVADLTLLTPAEKFAEITSIL